MGGLRRGSEKKGFLLGRWAFGCCQEATKRKLRNFMFASSLLL